MTSAVMRPIRLAFGAAVATVCIWLAVRHLNWSEAAALLRRAAPGWLLLAVAALVADYFIRIVRWWLMLRAIAPLPFRAAAGPLLSGMALNNVLPFRAGDVARTAGFSRELGMPVSRVLATMLVERLLDLATLILVFALAAAVFASESIPAPIVHTAVPVGGLCLVGAVILLAIPHRLADIVRWPWLREVLASLGAIRTGRLLVPLVLLSCAAWLLEGFVFAAAAASIGVRTPAAWLAMATGTLGTLVPGTPGYIGTFDYFTTVGFTLAGVAREPALICALLAHLVIWTPITAVGLIWFGVMKVRHAWHSEACPVEAAP